MASGKTSSLWSSISLSLFLLLVFLPCNISKDRGALYKSLSCAVFSCSYCYICFWLTKFIISQIKNSVTQLCWLNFARRLLILFFESLYLILVITSLAYTSIFLVHINMLFSPYYHYLNSNDMHWSMVMWEYIISLLHLFSLSAFDRYILTSLPPLLLDV